MFGRIRKQSRTGNQNSNDDNVHADSYEPIPKTVEAVKVRLSEIFSGCSDFLHREIYQPLQRSVPLGRQLLPMQLPDQFVHYNRVE